MEVSVGDWVVLDRGWGVKLGLVTAVTAKQIQIDRTIGLGRHASRVGRDGVLVALPDEQSAKRIAELITSARAERDQRIKAARVWCDGRVAEICAGAA